MSSPDGCSLSGVGFVFPKPLSQKHFLTPSARRDTHLFRWIGAKNHGLPVNHDPKGNLRLPIMLAGKSPQEQVGKLCHPILRKLPYRRACCWTR